MADSIYVKVGDSVEQLDLGQNDAPEYVQRIEALEQSVADNLSAQSTRDAAQDAAISTAQNAASKALVSAVIEDGELVLTYGNGTVKRESLPGGLPLGTLMPYTGKDVPAGFLRADGATYTNMRASFPEFYDWVVQSGLTVPLASYALVEGSCGAYGLDTSTGTVRMPTLAAGVFGTTAAGQYGAAVGAGLPNITGTYYVNRLAESAATPITTGAFKDGGTGGTAGAGLAGNLARGIGFDASLSNPIYGASDTVQPPHVKYPWVISVYNAAVAPSVAQAGEFVDLLDGKADVNLGNVTEEGKARVVGWGMPDYSAGVTVSSFPFTAPSTGVLEVLVDANGMSKYLTINNVTFVVCDTSAAVTMQKAFYLSKGDVVRNGSSTTGTMPLPSNSRGAKTMFFPLKGA